MQIRQSKTLQKHLDKGRFDAQRSGNAMLTGDVTFLSLIAEGMCHAEHILSKLLKDWEIFQLRVRIEREAAKSQAGGPVSDADADSVYDDIITGIGEICTGEAAKRCSQTTGAHYANSGHFLLWLLGNRSLISSRALELYGVTEKKVHEYLDEMPLNEDYYEDIEILQQLAVRSLVSRRNKQNSETDDNSIESDINHDDEYSDPTVAAKNRVHTTSLEKFGTNLSEMAVRGEIDPVVGRDREIERLIQILGRRKKNNPILIGEAGVGKSAIVEGLALRIAEGSVPHQLVGKQVFSLDIASMVAGTKYRGEFEQRIKGVIDELKSNNNTILFIDEIHTIAGAGSSQGSLDTANILKPALARGELQCIGATTLDEYRENIESDSALERRFQKIIVEPTTKEQTLQILRNIKSQYEQHHSVRYSDEALKACVELTGRYITNRNFPDKAIDVLDEAGSKARIFSPDEPEELKKLEAALAETIAKKDNGTGAPLHGNTIEDRIREHTLRTKISECRSEYRMQLSLNPIEIGVEHIEEVITSMTGIPVERVSQDELKRLSDMESHIASRVVGQDAAVGKVVRSVRRSRTGLKDPGKPIGVFMFVGPTGVGKTHLAKELSKWMFDKDDAIVRVDMSEYSEKHNVSRMIGSPPGYVGYNEGGQLTEAVRRQPYSVVLFDEIEKAHPDVFNIMLQIFDDGQLTDGNGRKVDFRNTIIIMTSNVGSRAVAQRPAPVGYLTGNKPQIEATVKESGYREALERTFAPEFINRIDDIVVFDTLGEADIVKIVDLELSALRKRTEALGYKLGITSKAKRLLAKMGYRPNYGVRSLKRTILEKVEEPIAKLIVEGQVVNGTTIRVEARAGEIEVLPQAARMRKTS